MSNPYYVCSELPEPFKAADLLMAQTYPQPKYIREPREVPMPTITENRGAEGPLKVTEEWYIAQKQKQDRRFMKKKREAEIDMIQLIARKEMLRAKLGELNPAKSKDSKRIAAINIELINIDNMMAQLEMETGISPTELDHGTKVGRFLGRLKQRVKKIGKSIKKFYKRNYDLINGLASIVLPIFGSLFLKKIFKI